jgi:O-antigen ligase
MSEAFVLRLLPVSLALIPLVIAPGLSFYFDVTPKIAVLLIAAGLALFCARENALGFHALRASRLGRWFIYLLSAQAAVIVIATAFSNDLALSIVGGAWRRSGAIVELGIIAFVLLLAARFASTPHAVEVTLRLIAASSLLVSAYAIAQFFGLDPFLPAAAYHAGEGIWTIVRPPSTMGNANFLANYLIYAAFCSVALIRKDRSLWSPISAAAFALGMIAIVLSGTRSGILGLLTALAVLVFGISPRQRIWILGSGICATAIVALLAITPLGLPLKARIRWSREDALGGGRLLLWRDSLRMFAHRPLTGFGPDTFTREFPPYRSTELARLHPDFYQESPHNALLDAALTAGAPGFIVSIVTVGFGFYVAWHTRMRSPRLALCLTAALAGGIVSAQFSPPVLVTRLYPLVLIAIVCASGPSQQHRPQPARFFKTVSVSLGTALLLFALALLISDLLAGSFKRSVDAGNIDAAVSRYRILRDYSLPAFTVDLYAARSLAQLSQRNAPLITRALAWQTALNAGNRAVRTEEERQNAFYNLAQLYALQNDIPRTEENLRCAIQYAPNWFKPHWILAQLLQRTGRIPEARDQARIAWDLDAGKDTEVARTWQALGSPR